MSPSVLQIQTYPFLSSFHSPSSPRKGLFPHFIDNETEAQRSELSFSSSHSKGRIGSPSYMMEQTRVI